MLMAAFRHEAFLYAGHDDFVAGALAFLAAPLTVGRPALVMTDGPKLALLRAALGERAAAVDFADMEIVGRNPARIIPAWAAFAEANHGVGPLWGIGEPVWPGRSPAELDECRHHEVLLNLAFSDSAFHLLCPYDIAALEPSVVDDVWASHPRVSRPSPQSDNGAAGDAAHDVVDSASLLAEALPEPPAGATVIGSDLDDLHGLRCHVQRVAAASGLAAGETDDLVLAVDEVATNSLCYGGGAREVLSWVDAGAVVCEVRDGGRVTDPLVGRRRPPPDQLGGRGLWIANQLCDLVQVRSSDAGTVVRLHKRPALVASL
jgi:anti-sigma regulatory factor (Ser/Thr protein kinase)